MKKYYILIIAGVTMGLASCSKWLDLSPQTDISQGVLFSTQAGFEDALNGVYSHCAKESYGGELTFGTLDVLAQNYTIPALDIYAYKQTSLYNYNDKNFIERRDDFWKNLYTAIANSNLILHHIKGQENLFTNREYELIKGEALALRAYLHFDLLRLFGPSFASNPTANAIPYVTTFSKNITPMGTVSAIADSIINDLNAAKELLKVSDPILNAGYKVGYSTQDSLKTNTELNGPLFLQNRRHRMNYYAVCAELARVYLYKGDKANALKNALEVIESNKFPWTRKDDFVNGNDELKDRILYKELVFAWYIPNQTDALKGRFRNGENSETINSTDGQTIYEVAGVGGDDFRYKQWFSQQSGASGIRLQLEKYTRDPDKNLHYQMAPALRLSEVYYIAAECTFDTDAEKAWGYFNTVRVNRGIRTSITNQPSKEIFLTELIKEARKEFYGEGQIFYMYKRLNKPVQGFGGSSFPATDKIFVLPLPDDEIQFGNR